MKKFFASIVLLALASCNTPIDRMALCIKVTRATFADVEFVMEMDQKDHGVVYTEREKQEIRRLFVETASMVSESDRQEIIINQCRAKLDNPEPVSKMDIEIWRCVERNSTARAMRDCTDSVKAKYFE